MRVVSCAILLLAAGTVITPAVAAPDHPELRQALAAKMPGVRIGDIRALPYSGLYEVVANGLNVFYTNDRGDIALMGELIQFSTGRERPASS